MRAKYIQIAKALYPVYNVYRFSNDWGFYCSDSIITFIADNDVHHHILGFSSALAFSPGDSAYIICTDDLIRSVDFSTPQYAIMCRLIGCADAIVQSPYAQ